ncbi:pentapeptide repeat-containing protein [Methylocapsa sp. D3K7]|uniref:pentapeptide repeat-containing protein n=1 Tax=Methylocapsa sp. D3K7 TaxID=3041435 RepID=UPI00244E907B|nr:pentapeptide repeat-containing protein [Methylocapsa sp. D3K7]WGJ15440.1 pentapeptide repeat-containing protein [Methylocapsa sp. D3K7]
MFHVKRFGTIDAKVLASRRSGPPLGLVRPAKAAVFLRLFWGRGWAAMSNDPEEPESGAGAAKPPQKSKAEDNPWYLLATLYGEPALEDSELRTKNRIAWNRYFAANLDDETREQLIEQKRHPAEDLTPLSAEELAEVGEAFVKRASSSATQVLPPFNIMINFSGVQFTNNVYFADYLFAGVTFFVDANFFGELNSYSGATFFGGTFFDRVIFSGNAHFHCANFCGGASFIYVTFLSGACFDGAIFPSAADFLNSTFSQYAGFRDATFCRYAAFHGATFSGQSFFNQTKFYGRVLFDGAKFHMRSSFVRVEMKEETSFENATFFGETRFTSAIFERTCSFVNAEMKGETFFDTMAFNMEPPKFFGAKLHQGTVWRGITWPPTPKGKDEAGVFVDAYACLKLEMDRLKKHEDELKFFSLELRSLRILRESKFRGSGIPIALYGIICDYGRSYIRPLIGLFVVAAIGALIFLPFKILSPWESLSLSFANTFNVFGFRKDYFDAATISNLPDLLKVLSAVQTILGTILLFLVGLGIRNRFRMK